MKTRTKQQPFLMRAATTALALAQATRRATAALAIILLTAQTAWADSTFSGGDGSQGNPYKIANETDLRQLATDVNGGNSYSGKFFQQSQNITLTQNFTSIGCSKSSSQGGSKSFSGTYDGGNKTISGLTINGSTNEQGLFGQVENATIQNLTLSGASVTNSASYVGAFVGWSNGGLTMTNCHAVNCEVTASNKNSVAIFVGYLTNSASTIKSCTVSGGSVSGNKNVGAIVGYAYGSSNDHAIVGCVARGVTGGDNLIGTNTYSCVSNVASYGNNDYTITAGTGVTITYSAVSNTYSDIIHPPYIKAGETVPVTLSYTGSLSNVTYQATGATLNDEGTQLSNAQGNVTITATEATKTDISGGSIADIAWQTWTGSALTPALTVTVGGKTLTAGTDYLVNYTDNTHIGTATATVTGTGAYKGTLTKTFEIRYSGLPYNSTGNFYEIGNETALRALSSYVGSGGETSGRTFKQTEDITLTSSFSPIGISNYYQFHGIYDGNNKTIGGLSVSGDVEYAALFGYMFGGTVKNVILISPSVSSSYKHTIGNAGARVSALVGSMSGNVGSMNANAIIDNCIVINPTLSATGQGNNYVGIFIGESGSRCSISNCYYYDGNTEHNYATHEYDDYISATNILRVYAVNATGCTATATPTISVGGTDYYKEGTAVTLSLSGGTAPEGYLFGGYTVNGTAIDGNTFTIGSEDAAITATISIDPAQFSQSGDTYTIHTAGGWNVFCDALQDNDTYNRFSGKTVRLGADITVTRMAGSGDNPFCGNFDGGGNTLTFTATAADNYCAPFVGVKGGTTADDATTISNLNVVTTITANDYRHTAGLIALQWGHVNVSGCNATVNISSTVGDNNPHDLYPAALVSQASSSDGGTLTVTGCTASGTISTDGKYAAGLVGIVQGTASIDNCRVSVTIQSTTSGDGTHGGLVASQPSKTTITITGCLFDGRLLGSATNKCGGFIGWRGGTATIYNSLFAPTEVTVQNEGSATFARNTTDTYNCYYTTLFNDGTNYAPALADGTVSPAKWHNGKATRSVTAGTDVILYSPGPLDNTNTYYNVSGIRAYTTGGLYYNHNLYYGSGDRLSILLGNTRDDEPLGYRYTYAFSGGTADEYEYSADDGETSYHLTMPDADVTVSLDTEHLAPIDWATVNQGNSTDPYMIYNKDQLDLLAHRVNGTHGETANDFNGVYFKLGANITYAPQELTIDNDNDGTNDSNYEAISSGSGGTFNGHFNGDNKTISGIRIYKGGTNKGDKQQGLFGNTGSSASIYNLNLVDADITGYSLTGGIVGNNQGTVSNCHVAASVIIRAVQNEAYYHGGIVGFNLGTITHCTSSATLAVGDDVTERAGYGGIAGDNDETGKLIDNLVIGAVVPTAGYSYGAICGYNRGTIARNYYRACTVANSENATGVGCYKSDVTDDNGAVPVYTLDLSTGITTTSEPVINYDNTNYYAGTITLNGGLPDDAPEHYTYAYTVNGNAISGNTFAINADATVGTGLYPADWATEGNSGTETDPYMIYNKDQLDLLAHRVNGTHGETANDYEGKWFQLGTDITYAPQELTIDNDNDNDKTNDSNYEAIGSGYRSFNGHFDGAGHTVSGIRIYSGGTFAYFCQGLFGTTGSSANIHDVTLADADITGDFYTGGIVGENQGTVSNCHVAASVIVRAVQDGAYQHGGIVGRNRPSGTVSSCTSAATLTIADGVTDCQYYGGIAGVNEGSLTDNLATGAVVPAAAYNTYGAISGVKDGTLQHNYYTACTVANVKNATGVGCGGIYDGGDYTVADITDDDGAVPALRDNADNTKAIALLAALASTTDNHTPVDLGWGEGQFPLQLVGRTLYKDGAWNTLCLPFDVSVVEGSPLDGAEVKTLTGSAFAGGKLTLNFSTTSETTLTAGKPYIVRWDKPDNYVAYDGTNAAECSDLVCPVFTGVTVSTATANVETDCVDFIGILSPTVIYEDGAEKTNLYMGADNKLYYPTVEGFKLNACRGYFKLKGVVVNGNGNDNGNENAVRSFDINFGDDATGIVEMRDEKGEMRNGHGYEDGGWYTVDGRRLDGKPAQKGLYIHGGRKVVIK